MNDTHYCYITGNSLKRDEVIHGSTIVRINSSQDALKYKLAYSRWEVSHLSKSTQPSFKENEIRRLRAFVFNKNQKKEIPGSKCTSNIR